MIDESDARRARAGEALSHAVKVIAAYQAEIRSFRLALIGPGMLDSDGPTFHGPTLADVGFCQGSIYLGAQGSIERILSGGNDDE